MDPRNRQDPLLTSGRDLGLAKEVPTLSRQQTPLVSHIKRAARPLVIVPIAPAVQEEMRPAHRLQNH